MLDKMVARQFVLPQVKCQFEKTQMHDFKLVQLRPPPKQLTQPAQTYAYQMFSYQNAVVAENSSSSSLKITNRNASMNEDLAFALGNGKGNK
jgi:hypothetical protein